ncbi:MAG: zinc ribbon domain-containing protein [Wenzhouxiangellaceae bacterium]|nr:zinc ribbon domain-containing protein [Wenzhouxiangellaceae bacterium]
MPIYEYQCRSCQHRLEKLQKMSDVPLLTCPECGRDELTKLVSAAGFRLKGGGWYETDFKKDGRRNLAGDQSSGSSGDQGKSVGADAGSSDKSSKDKTDKPKSGTSTAGSDSSSGSGSKSSSNAA